MTDIIMTDIIMTDNELLKSIHALILKTNEDTNNKINNLENMIHNLENMINTLNEKIDRSIDNIESKNIKNMPMRNFRKEKFDLDESVLKKTLERATIAGDYEVFKLMYLNVDKELYPIKKVDNNYCYWNNGFHKDNNCEYIKSVISHNIQHCYFKVNKYDESKENSDKFIKNQEHIDILKDDKYLVKLIEYIYKRL